MLGTITKTDVISMFGVVMRIIKFGLALSCLGYVIIPLHRWIGEKLGIQSIHPNDFKRISDILFSAIFDFAGSKAGAIGRSPRSTVAAFQLILGTIVLATSLLLEAGGAYALIGAATISPNLFSDPTEVVALYRIFVAFILVMTISIMSYGQFQMRERFDYR